MPRVLAGAGTQCSWQPDLAAQKTQLSTAQAAAMTTKIATQTGRLGVRYARTLIAAIRADQRGIGGWSSHCGALRAPRPEDPDGNVGCEEPGGGPSRKPRAVDDRKPRGSVLGVLDSETSSVKALAMLTLWCISSLRDFAVCFPMFSV